jgi:hypothetical protein
MKNRTLAAEIAQCVDAWKNCQKSGLTEWESKWDDRITVLERQLPSGSGIDCGTKIDRDRTTRERVVLTFSFHHMDENGYYDGWTEHTVVITPSFSGLDLRITGRDRNYIKEYLYQTYEYELSRVIETHLDHYVIHRDFGAVGDMCYAVRF